MTQTNRDRYRRLPWPSAIPLRSGVRPLTLLALASTVVLAACSSDDGPVATRIDATVTATEDANPDFNGEASPVFVRIFELTSDSAFNTATFSALWNEDSATLGAEMVGREEVVLTPGASTVVGREFQPGSKVMAVVASYQNIDSASWRATAPVTENQVNGFEVTVGRSKVEIAEKPIAPPDDD